MRWKQFVLLSAAIGVVLGGVEALAQWASIRPDGDGASSMAFLLVSGLIGTPFLLMAFLTLPIGLCLAIFRRSRRAGLHALLGAVSLLSLASAGASVGNRSRIGAFREVARRLTPLVMAIREYDRVHGQAPRSLALLAPRYIETVPATGIDAYPVVRYEIAPPGGDVFGGRWMLYVNCPTGIINFDRFVYLPSGDYSWYESWGAVERVGDWAYIHE